MKSRMFLAVCVFFLSFAAHAENDYLLKCIDSETEEVSAVDQIWIEGLHIDAGLGFQGGVYLVEGSAGNYAVGSAIKTDVSYYFNEKWAWESSGMIKFSRVDELRIWGTELSMGFRYRLPQGWYDEQVPYFRLFVGSNINVVYTDGQKLPEFEEAYSRIQFEGPMAGIGFGGMRLTESKKNMWFWEVSVTGNWLKRESGIQMEKDVPVVFSRSALDGRSQLYTIYVTFGGRIF